MFSASLSLPETLFLLYNPFMATIKLSDLAFVSDL
jgi:hypothetical protein